MSLRPELDIALYAIGCAISFVAGRMTRRVVQQTINVTMSPPPSREMAKSLAAEFRKVASETLGRDP